MLVLLLATGCLFHNACQRLCNDMQDKAKECGYEFSPEDLKTCFKEQRRGNLPEDQTVGDCKDAAPQLDDEWTCEEFEDYFDAVTNSGDSAQ